jgi:signal transduction histidine kinase
MGKNSFVSIARDITERKRNDELIIRVERQIEYERMRTEYFANISHDFRTPLHAISGTLQLMEMKNAEILKELPLFSIKNKRYLEIMKQNNNRLIKLVNNLIDINKIEAGAYIIIKKNRDVMEIICNVVSSVTELARSENIKTSCQIDSGPVVLACDIEKIERIMLNLLSNAIKFTPSGGHVKTTMWNENGRLFVSVEDTGQGIKEDQLERIFDRFSQAEDVFTSSNEGSGIGLSLVKGFVKMHEGSICVKSEIGKGSTFTYDIPIEVERDEEGEQLPVEAYDDFTYGSKLEVEFSDVKKRFYEVF